MSSTGTGFWLTRMKRNSHLRSKRTMLGNLITNCDLLDKLSFQSRDNVSCMLFVALEILLVSVSDMPSAFATASHGCLRA